MEDYSVFVFARVLHVLGVVLWIGGVAFVTTVLIAAIKQLKDTDDRYQLFEKLEGRFAFQAKITTLITGLTGFYMTWALDGWSRYLQPEFWWMHLMTVVWLIFTLVLFVFEPLFLHRWFEHHARQNSDRTFRIIHRMHIVLLTLSLITVAGAVAGSHGWLISL